jgi:hypothetical protein
MPHVRKLIRDAAAVALTGLATTGSRVFENRVHTLQEDQLPALRVYTNNGASRAQSVGMERVRERGEELMVECCAKAATGFDDQIDAMILEVEQALDANQGIGGAKSVELRSIQIDMDDEADREIGIARLTFDVLYYTALGAPDEAL